LLDMQSNARIASSFNMRNPWKCFHVTYVKEMVKPTAKEKMAENIGSQPEDSSFEEILCELAFHQMIERGLEDSRAGRTISNEEMAHRIRTWQKQF